MSKLGDLGEKIAVEVLSRPQNGFVKVRNLNTEHPNHPYVDLYAERNGTRYVISVKTRRKYGADGNLNDHFNLLEKSKGSVENKFQEFELVKAKAQEYNATAAWVMVVGESSVFSAYFGLFEDVQRSGIYSVRMKPIHLTEHECLVENEPHQYPDFIRVKIGTVMKPDVEPKSDSLRSLFIAPKPTPDEILGLAAQVYAGLSEQEVADVEKVALDRSSFAGPRQLF